MKNLLLLLSITLCTTIHAQDCAYDFTMGTVSYVPKQLVQTEEQKDITRNKVAQMKSCFKRTKDEKERYWLASSIASTSHVMSDPVATVEYSLQAFEIDPASLCKEYIDMHVDSRDEDFPFKKHYLDVLEVEQLVEMRTYCQENFLEDKTKAVAEAEHEAKQELASDDLQRAYLQQLLAIGEKDQAERKKTEIDWSTQNQLDKENREQLDKLYQTYGFPSRAKVTKEGVISAFMVLHHSTDCEWNEKWTTRFLDHYEENDLANLFAFYFYRNFNPEDGGCRGNTDFLEGVRADLDEEEREVLLDFSKWDKMFKDR